MYLAVESDKHTPVAIHGSVCQPLLQGLVDTNWRAQDTARRRYRRSRGPLTCMNWQERDANVVWHGFTQMQCYTANAPVIVERAEGRELIDVEGRRYLDAISSLWVTTLGHRVAELDQALREQLER